MDSCATDTPVHNGNRYRTLIVDDSQVTLQTLCFFLESQENIHIVGTAENGRQALEIADALKPDLVLMDLQMPEMDGLTATVHLRRMFPSARIIILTTFDCQDVRLASATSGADGFVSKNRLHQELPAEIRRAFRP